MPAGSVDGKIKVYLSALAILVPYLFLLFGRNFHGDVVDSSVIINPFWRKAGAILALLLCILSIAVLNWKMKFAKKNALFFSLIGIYLLYTSMSLCLSFYKNNPIGYIVSDLYNSIAFVFYFLLGYAIARDIRKLEEVLRVLSWLGLAILLYELTYSLFFVGANGIRYGSGLAMNLLPMLVLYAIFTRNNLYLVLFLCVTLLYVLLSSSRLQLLLWLLLTLLILFSGFFSKKSKVMLISFVPIIVVPSLLLFGEGFWVAFIARLESTSGLQYIFLPLDQLWAHASEIDNSLLGRLLETNSALLSIDNWFIGNGLGATFNNARAELVSQWGLEANNHYIHITLVLILLRQGIIGVVIWAVLFIGVLHVVLKYKQEVLLTDISKSCIYLFIICIVKFALSSGAFFVAFNMMMFLFGAYISLVASLKNEHSLKSARL